jgi:hypothetical protein
MAKNSSQTDIAGLELFPCYSLLRAVEGLKKSLGLGVDSLVI